MKQGYRPVRAALVATVTAVAALALPTAPAAASPPPSAAPALPAAAPPATSGGPATDAGDLVVGLRPGADIAAPLQRLPDAVDVREVERLPGRRAAQVDVADADAAAALAALRRDPAVRYVERNAPAAITAVTADDYYRADQWELDRVAAPAAWQHTTGDAAVTVAVLDTGVTATADLPADRITAGYDIVNGDADPADDHGHGTLVATTVAGAGGDAADGGYHGGIAGMCWTCRVMPVKVLDQDGGGDLVQVAAGIDWAVAHGADVVNLSLGGYYRSTELDEAVARAIAAGVPVVAAAGNDGVGDRFYPAATPGVVAVGASTEDDGRYAWSNHGTSWVDVAAPGCVGAGNRFGEWQEFCGTSAASPVVSGVLALARALRPAATVAQLTGALTGAADPLPAAWTAFGRVNARGAVGPFLPAGGPDAALSGVNSGGFVSGAAFPLTYGATDPDGVATVSLLVDGAVVATAAGAGPHATTVDTRPLRRGTGLTVVAEDGSGAVGTVAVPVVADNTPPAATITSPRRGQLVRGYVPVVTRATDAGGIAGVTLSVLGVNRTTDTAPPYAPVWDSRGLNGSLRLYTRTRDRAGHATLRYQIVTADNTAPSVARTGGPRSGARIRGTARVTARAADRYGLARVELLVNGRVAARDTRAPFVLSVAAARQPRTMRVQLRAVDRAGNARLSTAWRWTR